jgi:hypothetical protein
MTRYLVVAHKTAQSLELQTALMDIAGGDREACFTLLVPATPTGAGLVRNEEEAEASAQHAADEAHLRLRAAGLDIDRTIVGPADPVRAVALELHRPGRDYGGIVISTLPPGISRWLGMDAPGRIRRRFGLPVTQVTCHAGAAGLGEDIESAARSPAQHWRLTELSAYRGRAVISADGYKLGTLAKIVYDYKDGQPLWLGVGAGVHTYLVPASAASGEQDHLRLGYARATILNEPVVDIGEGFDSLAGEHNLYDYFGITFDELRDVRVLHQRDALPGLMRVTG